MMLESTMRTRHALLALLLPACLTLTACDLLGDEALANAKEAEGRAIGSGCRHTGRSLEECYKLNAKASKAAIFAGWRDMDGYMRDNKIDIIPPSAESAHPAGEANATNDANATHAAESAPAAADASTNPAKSETGKDKPPPAATPPNAASPSPTSPPSSKSPAAPKSSPKPSR